MPKLTFIVLLFSSLLILFFSNCQKTNGEITDTWFEDIREKILLDADLAVEHISYRSFANGQIIERAYYHGDQKLKAEIMGTDSIIVAKYYYSADGKFELRKEICENGKIGFEGIFYKSDSYGLSTWWHCNGQKSLQGIRYKDQEIGIWKSWNENGKLIKKKNYRLHNLSDSLKLIVYEISSGY